MRRTLLVAAMLGALASTGCAVVFKGSQQRVKFTSIPAGADVKVDGRFLGEAPLEADIDRDRSQNILVSKPGYTESYVQMRKKPDTPWFFWDIATCVVPITLCIPVLVDAISGAWYSYDDAYAVKLDAREVPPAPPRAEAARPPTPPAQTQPPTVEAWPGP